jgi:hypothetical protein
MSDVEEPKEKGRTSPALTGERDIVLVVFKL